MVQKLDTIIYWFEFAQIMKKPDFLQFLKGLNIPKSEFANSMFKYFDLNCDGIINKFEFLERLNTLKQNNFGVILDRFFELADEEKQGWISKH